MVSSLSTKLINGTLGGSKACPAYIFDKTKSVLSHASDSIFKFSQSAPAAGAVGETAAKIAAGTASTVAATGSSLIGTAAQTTAAVGTLAKPSFLTKIFRILSGECATDVANAIRNRGTVPLSEGLKHAFNAPVACEKVVETVAKKPGARRTAVCVYPADGASAARIIRRPAGS